MKKGLFIPMILSLWLAACGGGVAAPQPTATFTLSPTQAQRTIAECTAQSLAAPEMVGAGEHVDGVEQGFSVTIIVYNDFACTTCQSTEWAVVDSVHYFPEDIRLVYRHFANLEDIHSIAAAVAAEAAGLQGYFWEYHNALFDRQSEWVTLEDEAFEDWLIEQAVDLGMDRDQFTADFTEPALLEQVVAQSQQALMLGNASAPVVLVNGNPVPMYVESVASFYIWLGNLMIPAGRLANKQFSQCPEIAIDPEGRYLATLDTDKGEIVIALYADQAPFAVNSFIYLAEHDFYDEMTFFQVIEGQLALTGDPSGTGWGNPGYLYSLETGPGDVFDRPGLVAMWNSGPTSTGSQFFITYAPLPEFNGRYTIIGEVISGMEVLNSLTPRNAQLDPLAPPGDVIHDVTIEAQ
jgi:cyclophilin family peptidyl-prolyl cis-trans isomerase/protein-disulfide isomerase